MYSQLLAALRAEGMPPCAEYAWDRAPQTGNYMTVGLDGQQTALWGDDGLLQQAPEGSVHLFCRTNDRSDMLKVQTVLNQSGAAWRLEMVDYEKSTRLLHYQWVFSFTAL